MSMNDGGFGGFKGSDYDHDRDHDEDTKAFVPIRQYAVVHETTYKYEQPVSLSRQIVHMAPRPLPYQSVISHKLVVSPTPEILAETEDAFGNPISSLFIEAEHASLEVKSEVWVSVSGRDYPDDGDTPPWEQVRNRLQYQAGRPPHPADLEAARYLFESSRVRNKRELAAWALQCFPPKRPILAGVRTLMDRIHGELTFDPKATTVSTPVMQVFEQKRGVCQDFSHLMLSCLRSIGLAARYVSGYLLTHPPKGRPRLVGADASHAWVSVYVPDAAGGVWVDADPTNGMFPSLEHITVCWGRDYDDVIPLRGVLLGGGDHELDIAVTVAPASEYDRLFKQTK
jgi:transglutaminase-like putative cysteine protease